MSLPLPTGEVTPVTTRARAFEARGACAVGFIEHRLDFKTVTFNGEITLFDSNGSGVGAGDLNGDGRIDLVFANLGAPSAVFWNQGGLRFRREELPYSELRGVAIVDVDGDGREDIVFTQRLGPPLFLRNLDGSGFERVNLGNVYEPAYSMAWVDLDGDGLLDLVTASYNAELAKLRSNDVLFNWRGGVMVYRNLGAGNFEGSKLAGDANGLALLTLDLNGDGRPDIWVGNDYDMQDMIWLNTPAGFEPAPAAMFPQTSHSTMSLSAADIDNDGRPEVFSSDMKPYDPTNLDTWVAWLPMMQAKNRSLPRGNPQYNENMLYQFKAGVWSNAAVASGVDASGWAWSAQFGDLDLDGMLDLYVVNGMIDRELFSHLPGTELVERNQAYRNLGGWRFAAAPEWQLGSTSSGRGMIFSDLDLDGDLDIVINNLNQPVQIFENKTCGSEPGGTARAIEVDLRQAGRPNPQAIGARIEAQTTAGSMYRDVSVTGGHLSGDPARVHFGLPAGSVLKSLVVRWPDGAVSVVDGAQANSLIEVTR